MIFEKQFGEVNKQIEEMDKQIEEMDNQIEEIENSRKELYKIHQIKSYEERMGIIGKCYKDGNIFYKVIDLDISNDYRCFVLTFIKGDFDITDMVEYESVFRSVPFTENISDAGSIGVKVDSIMIKSLIERKEEISPEEFNEEYFKINEKILEIDKFLLADRLERIKTEKDKPCYAGLL